MKVAERPARKEAQFSRTATVLFNDAGGERSASARNIVEQTYLDPVTFSDWCRSHGLRVKCSRAVISEGGHLVRSLDLVASSHLTLAPRTFAAVRVSPPIAASP